MAGAGFLSEQTRDILAIAGVALGILQTWFAIGPRSSEAVAPAPNAPASPKSELAVLGCILLAPPAAMLVCGLLASRYAGAFPALSDLLGQASMGFGALMDLVLVAGAAFTLDSKDGGPKSVQWAIRVAWPAVTFGAAAALYYLKVKGSSYQPLIWAMDVTAAIFIVMTLLVGWLLWHDR